jgi:O-antigen/teichoic acid export membrane protein
MASVLPARTEVLTCSMHELEAMRSPAFGVDQSFHSGVSRLRRILQYCASFGLARGSLFFAPILVANLLGVAHYGQLEFAQAVASTSAPILALGTAAAVPLVLVRNVEAASWEAILLHHGLAVAVLLAVALASVLLNGPDAVWLVGLCASALMLQAVWSLALKSAGRAESALFLDAGFWGLLAISALAGSLAGAPSHARWIWVVCTLSGYVAVLLAFTLAKLILVRPKLRFLRYASTLRLGAPLMVGALLSTLATASGRLGVGLLSTPAMVGDYSVLFRATALPIVAHQVIMVASFRSIFELPTPLVQRRLSIVIGLVAACTGFVWILSGHIAPLLGPKFQATFESHRAEGLLILTQCILWSGVALNDMVNSRHQIAGKVAVAAAVYLLSALPIGWWVLSARPFSLGVYVPVHSLILAGYFVTQVVVMWRAGVRFAQTWTIALTTFVGLSILSSLK